VLSKSNAAEIRRRYLIPEYVIVIQGWKKLKVENFLFWFLKMGLLVFNGFLLGFYIFILNKSGNEFLNLTDAMLNNFKHGNSCLHQVRA